MNLFREGCRVPARSPTLGHRVQAAAARSELMSKAGQILVEAINVPQNPVLIIKAPLIMYLRLPSCGAASIGD